MLDYTFAFSSLFYDNPQPMWFFDVHTFQILEVNEAAVKEYEYTREEFLKLTVGDLRPAEDLPLLQAIKQDFKGNLINKRQFRHRTKSGRMLQVEVISFAMQYTGRSARLVVVYSLMEKLNLEHNLQKVSEKLDFTVENLRTAFIVLNDHGLITYWNKAAEQITGYSKESVLHTSFRTVFGHALLSEIRLDDQLFHQAEGSLHVEEYYWPLQKWLHIIVYNNPDGLSIQLEDISHRRHAEDAFKRKAEQIKQIAYLNSHQIRRPAANIFGLMQMLDLEKIADAEQREIVLKLKESSEQLEDVVQSVNERLNKYESDNIMEEGRIERFSVTTLIEELLHFGPFSAYAHQIVFERTDDIWFTGKACQINQAVSALIENAVLYTPVNRKIVIKCALIARAVIITVRDNGSGMDESKLQQLLLDSWQADKALSPSGMSLVARATKKHNGNFWVESKSGKGSSFHMRLPLGRKDIIGMPVQVSRVNPVSVYYNQTFKYLEINWNGYFNITEVKEASAELLKLVRKNDCRQLLNNNSGQLGGWIESVDWIAKELIIQLEAAGIDRVAWVYSKNTFSRLCTDLCTKIYQGDVQIQTYHNRQGAVKWLRSFTTAPPDQCLSAQADQLG
jgi:PAS domain S-box-containing protein